MEEMRLPDENDLRQTGTLWECPKCGHRGEVGDLMAIVANLSVGGVAFGVALVATWYVAIRESGLVVEEGLRHLSNAWPVALVILAFVVYGGIHAARGVGLTVERWRQRVTVKATKKRNSLSETEWRRFRRVFSLSLISVIAVYGSVFGGLFGGLPGIVEISLLVFAFFALISPLLFAGAFDLKGQEVMFASGVSLVVLAVISFLLAMFVGWSPLER